MKSEIIKPLLKMGIHVMTRMQQEGNYKYVYKELHNVGKGKNQFYVGKVNVKNIGKRGWKVCFQEEEDCSFELAVWCVALKQKGIMIHLKITKTNNYSILLSIDRELADKWVPKFYRFRFQIGLILRDEN